MSRLLILSCLMTLLIGACQVGSGIGNQQQSNPQPPSAMPGGEVAQDVDSPQAQALLASAENLLRQKYPDSGITLTALESLTHQVVAGINYRLVAHYTDQQGREGKIHLTIYHDLEDHSSLSEDNYPG